MIRYTVTRSLGVLLFLLGLSTLGVAQTYPFSSGPIPLCATSTFTANVTGIGTLVPPWTGGFTLNQLTINITSDHPQTLQITLTSPEGTDLLLSEFNGAGGQNYTNTTFGYSGNPSITTGTAPFTGWFTAQGGGFNVFDWQNGDGTWTITVTDTACANGGSGPGGTWTPGWFDGGAGNGGFSFTFEPPPPQCWGYIPSDVAYICSGAAVDLQGYYLNFMPGYNYMFTGPDWAPVPDPTAVTIPGQYWIDAMDPWDGCMYSATYDVIVSTPASLGPDQVVDQCDSDGPVDLTALFTMSGGTPIWSLDGTPIANTTAMSATDPGLYQLIEENTGGCNDTAFVTLNITAGAVLGPDQVVDICSGSVVDLTTLYNTAGYTAEWSFGGAVFASPEGAVDAGVYTLVATTPNGCTGMADVTLVVGAALALGPDQAHDLCDNSALDLTALYNTTGYTATWTYNSATILAPEAVYQGGTYQLVASNGGGCTDTALVVVTLNLSPNLGSDLIDSTCENEAADLTIFYPTTGLITSWTLAGTAVPDPTTVYVAGLYTLIATDANACSDTAWTEILVMPVPVLGPDQSVTVCDGALLDLTTLYATGGNTTAWMEGGASVQDPTAVTAAGVYTLTATSPDLCAATAVVNLALDPAPALGADVQANICAGSTFDLTPLYSTTGLAAAWTLDGAAVADPSAVDVTGDYQLVVTNGFGCTDTAVVELTVDPAPDLGADLTFALCPWQTVDLSAVFPVAGMMATYTFDGQSLNDPTSVQDPGPYSVNVTDANGCMDEAMATVSNIECLCEANFTDDATCFQEPVQFTLVADSTVLSAHWDFDGAASISTAIDPVVGFSSDGDVLVTLQATLSCGVVEVQRAITLQDCTTLCSVWIPSSFTPNNDTWNDTWNCSGACEPEDFSVEIYDRFGEVIFASNDPLSGWDGTYSGGPSPTGVYAYRVGYSLPYQKRKEVTGSITLVR